eukprot:scaffold57031_cov46-Phaeocystis_antarctica.AAC.3
MDVNLVYRRSACALLLWYRRAWMSISCICYKCALSLTTARSSCSYQVDDQQSSKSPSACSRI